MRIRVNVFREMGCVVARVGGGEPAAARCGEIFRGGEERWGSGLRALVALACRGPLDTAVRFRSPQCSMGARGGLVP